MSDPLTPRPLSASNSRTSEALTSASRGMWKWLKEPSPATFGSQPSTGQLLPQQTLRSRLENAARGLTPPKTLAASVNSEPLETKKKSVSHASDDTLTGVETLLVQRSKSPVDLDAPYPTPLHVIAAIVDSVVTDTKIKLQNHIWELSDLDAESDKFEKANKYREACMSDHSDEVTQEVTMVKMLIPDSAPPPAESQSVSNWLDKDGEAPVMGPQVDLSRPDAIRCDIDTFTGELIPAIEYPETLKNQIEGESTGERDIAWRQANMTSALQIAREINVRSKIAQQVRARFRTEQEVKPPPPPQEDPWPRAKCLIRPALPKDFDRIAEIINLETQKSHPRVLQSEVATPQLIAYIFHYCQGNHRPFIVAEATEDEIINRAKWPGTDDDYEDYCRFKKSQKPVKPVGILGFAYVTESRVGFLLSACCSGSKYSGKIQLLVHPDHQNKKIGSALLDRILATTAIYHRSLLDYKWEFPGTDTLIYDSPSARNKRKYTRLYLETAFGKDDPQKEWISEWLKKFEFQQLACFPEALKTDRKAESEWLDLVVWAYEARPVAEIVE